MNNLIKEKSRCIKEEVKTLELKKESLNDKVEMQENFIEEVESRGKETIEEKNNKIDELDQSVAKLIKDKLRKISKIVKELKK